MGKDQNQKAVKFAALPADDDLTDMRMMKMIFDEDDDDDKFDEDELDDKMDDILMNKMKAMLEYPRKISRRSVRI